MTPALSVDAELVLERGEYTFRVWSEADRIVVEAPSLSALRALDELRGALPVGSDLLEARLTATDYAVDVQVRRATVARVGAGVRGDLAGRLLTGTDAALDLRGVATAAVRALG